jgi:group I intron endonuclease
MIVYKTTNEITGRIYIGKAVGKNIINGYLGSGVELTPDISKYGKKSFKREIVDIATDRLDQNRKERFWISFYREKLGDGSLYNLSDGGEGGRHNRYADLEYRRKLSNSHKGLRHSVAAKLNMSKARIENNLSKGENNPFYGKVHSLETKSKMSISMKRARAK